MPSSIFFQGQRVYRPGTYVRVNDTLSAISDLTGGNIALVGDFAIFPQGEIQTFSTFDSFVETVNPDGVSGLYYDVDYTALADIAFDALVDANQQIDSLSIINTRASEQASFTSNGLKVKSKLYGPVGNRLTITLAASSDRTGNAEDDDFYDIFVFNGGLDAVEEMLDIGDGEAAKLSYAYTNDPAGDADGEFDYGSVSARTTATHIEVEARKTIGNDEIIDAANQNAQGNYELVFNKQVEGVVSITTLGQQVEATNFMDVIGFNQEGTLTTERVTMHDAQGGEVGDTFTTTNSFVSIERIIISALTDGDVILRWYPKSTKLEDVGDLEGWLADLSRRNSDFTYVSPSTVITGDELDFDSALSSINNGASYIFTTNLHRISERAFNASKWVVAEKLSNTAPAVFASEPLLGGSNDPSTPISKVEEALEAILYKNINIVVPATDDIEIHKLVKQHCKDASEKAGLERNAWLGTEADRSLDYVHNIYVKELNDRNCAVVCQGVKLAKNGREFRTPWYTALALASVQASTAIAEPMTRKVIQGISPIQTTFDPDAQANKAIRLSIVILNNANGPIRVERSVTTFRRNLSHPVFCEVSANESINTCLRTLRSALDVFIGGKATGSQAGIIARAATNHLDNLRDRGIIANYKDVSVVLNGDVLNVTFDVAAIEPLNFITVQANLGQF
jgi:hypothetical protein